MKEAAPVLLYGTTLFTSAFLLFYVQPLIAKLLLPYLGGSPAVWNTCMVFFQALLLAGYAYSHFLPDRLGVRRHAVLHLALLAATLLVLPFGVSPAALRSLSSGSDPSLWLLATLAGTVGLPFFAVSANGPLLQKWFSFTRHPRARDPYFLYGASNLGSLLALLGYPLILEPSLGLGRQSWLWAILFGLLVALIGLCALALWKGGGAETGATEEGAAVPRPVTAARRLWWVTLAFVPSSLMLGVTSYLTTDLAPVPLLWVLPLSLYLLTFIIAFSGRGVPSRRAIHRYALPLLAFGVVSTLVTGISGPLWFLAPLHLLFFFVAALVCHLRLADDRPEARRLTEFYLWLSVGGVLGGIFNALVAPVAFSRIVEYPLVIVAACLLRPPAAAADDSHRSRALDIIAPLLVGLFALGSLLLVNRTSAPAAWGYGTVFAGLAASYRFVSRPTRFALSLGAVIVASGLLPWEAGRALRTERNFFGVVRVVADEEAGAVRMLHGNTIHGTQFKAPERRCEPTTYYHRRGPFGAVVESFSSRPASPHVAVVGLGAGTMAAYAAPGQRWTFYEIDPAVVRVARDEGYFSYLTECALSRPSYVIGDARLRLAEAPDGHYGLIVLDAFSSDAIPVHLMTREAVRLYVSKLAPGGMIAVHISNKHLDLAPVLSSIADREQLTCHAKADEFQPGEGGNGPVGSRWVVMARAPGDVENLLRDPAWRQLEISHDRYLWTDDYSNILSVYSW